MAQAHLAVVPDDLSRPVGQSNPTLTYHYTGFVNGEDSGSAGITGAADLATTAATASPAGNYPITVTDAGSLSAANYDFPSNLFGTGTLTVSPSAASVAVGSTLPDSTYGQSVSFTVVVSGSGPVPQGTVQFVVDGVELRLPGHPLRRRRDQRQHDSAGGRLAHRRRPVFRRRQLLGEYRQLFPVRGPGAPGGCARRPQPTGRPAEPDPDLPLHRLRQRRG